MKDLLKQLAIHRKSARTSELPENIKKLKEKGKYPVRERIARLLDPKSSFTEIGELAGLEVYPEVPTSAGMVCGIGRVSNRPVMIVANDPTIKGGTYFPLTVKKHLRAQEIAAENHLPCLYLVDSGGAYLPLQDQVFPDKEHFGRIFFNQARMSAAGIPQIAAVLGSCTAGGAYVPAMSDQTIMVRHAATVFLGGPPLVKAATGAEVSAEELGGADLHCRTSGVADYLVDSEQEALLLLRSLVAKLGTDTARVQPSQSSVAPLVSMTQAIKKLPKNSKQTFPMRDVIASLCDASEFDEFKAEFGKTLITGFAYLQGILIGILANDGVLFSESAQKGAHFIQLCEQRKIPLLFLQNITGFMVGKEYEAQGIAKHGAKLVNAVACARVPKITLIVGSSFGAGNYGMCGRAYSPRFLFCWPNAQTAVMGPAQAASVLAQLKGKESENLKLQQTLEQQASSWYSTARLWDDGILAPEETRETLAQCFQYCTNTECSKAEFSGFPFGVFRM